MRQYVKNRESAEQAATAYLPRDAAATVAVAQATPIRTEKRPLSRRRTHQKERLTVKTRLARLVLGLMLVLVVPWMPAKQQLLAQAQPKQLRPAPGTANALYAELEKRYKNEVRPAAKGVTPETAAGASLHPLPTAFRVVGSTVSIEHLRAYNRLERSLLVAARAARQLPLQSRSEGWDSTLYEAGLDLTQIAIREGMVRSLDGQHYQAALAFLEAGEIGAHTHRLVRETALRSALTAIQPSLSHLTPTEARAVSERLEALLAKRPAFVTEYAQDRPELESYMELRCYPNVFTEEDTATWLTRVPFLRVVASIGAAQFSGSLQGRFDAIQSGAKTLPPIRSWVPGADLLGYLHSEFRTYQDNTQRIEQVRAALRAQMEE